MDLYVGNYIDMDSFENRDVFSCQANTFYHNNGDGTFTDIASELAVADVGCALAVTVTDYDNDGDHDLYVGNDFGPRGYPPNRRFRNDGPGAEGGWNFRDISAEAGIEGRLYSMGVAVGDYDNDGDLDDHVTSILQNAFYRNNGDGTFANVARDNGTVARQPGEPRVTWGTEFVDFDNNERVDLFVSSGPVVGTGQSNLLFFNQGDGAFTDIAGEAGVNHPGRGRGSVFGDYDSDGDVDFYLVNYGQKTDLFQNNLYANGVRGEENWFQVKLEGTRSKRDTIGARAEVVAGGSSQIRELGTGSPHSSQSGLVLNFGVGQTGSIDRLVIRWPSGTIQQLSDVAVNQRLKLVEPE